MAKDIYIAGLGIISALGNNIEETIAAFENHTSGVDKIKYLETVHKNTFPLAEVKWSNEDLADHLGVDKSLSRTILLSYFAAKQAFDSIHGSDTLKPFKTGFISATSVGGMDKTEFFAEDFLNDSSTGDLKQVVNHDNGKSTDFVARALGIKDFVTTISTACSSAANAIMLGSRLIKSGKLDIVIAGGVDPLTRFTLNGFNSLMIVDTEQCRPLDQTRAGLNLGEGAAYVVLMCKETAEKIKATTYCKVTGYCNTNDAFHQTALSDEGNGPFLAMVGALKMSGLDPEAIDYINMHGTGTQNNDNAEGTALKRIFHPHYPKLSSTKSFTGHTLGASGGIEAVFSAKALKEGYIYPNYKYENQMENLSIVPETSFQKDMDVNHIMSNSFGFGGNCTSLIFSK
jgi:3-oxoacyl-[acyl-carrier-protein] synthase-1